MSEHNLADVAAQLGFEFSDQPDESLKYGIGRVLPSDRPLGIDWLMQRRQDDATLAVARVVIRKDGNNRTRTSRETILYFEQPGLSLPNFEISPKRITSAITTGMMKLVGMPEVRFSEDQAFSDRFSVLAFQPNATRDLLTPEIRRLLCERAAFTIRGEQDRLVVYLREADPPPDELPAFVDEADDVLMTLVRRAREFPQLGISPAAETRTSIESMGGILGATMRSRIVRRDDIDGFLNHPSPRPLTPVIRKHYFGYGSIALYLLSALLLFGGGSLIYALATDDLVPPVVAVLLGILPLGGLVGIVVTFLYRHTRKRTLRAGDVCEAQVLKVRSTSVQVNNRQQFKVSLQYEHAGRSHKTTINAYEPAVQKAHTLAGSDAATRILVDPRNSRRLIWIDGLCAEG